MKHTITMKEVQTKIKNGVSTFSKKIIPHVVALPYRRMKSKLGMKL